MAFSGRHVLVAGGAGTIGTGIALALLKEGAKVTITSRSAERLKAAQDIIPASLRDNLFTLSSDVTTEEGVKEIFEQTTKKGDGVQHVVAAIGSLWQKGKLIDQPLSEFHKVIQGGVVGHFLLFKKFLPYLEKVPGSTYTFLTGNASEKYIVPNVSMTCISSGALNGMSLAILAEHKDSPVAIVDFRIHLFVQPKPDTDIPASENMVMGHDVTGEAIIATMLRKTRGQIDVRNRQETRQLASGLKK